MRDRDFKRFSKFIYEHCGLNLKPTKKTMLSLRLLKRMQVLGINSFSDYYDYVMSDKGRVDELAHMTDVITTNKTDFFREPKHFEFLVESALPALQKRKYAPRAKLTVWSAGCSSGEEPYTLAMILYDYFGCNDGRDFSILATDISTRVLAVGKEGIYPAHIVDPVPAILKPKFLMRGKGSRRGFCRIVPELRNRISFQRLNLIEGNSFKIRQAMDIIFCRNVVIYFDHETQIKLFKKFYAQLTPGGYLFIGHSETLHGINDRFVQVSSSVYRKPN